jgi:hypothetical protein
VEMTGWWGGEQRDGAGGRRRSHGGKSARQHCAFSQCGSSALLGREIWQGVFKRSSRDCDKWTRGRCFGYSLPVFEHHPAPRALFLPLSSKLAVNTHTHPTTLHRKKT